MEAGGFVHMRPLLALAPSVHMAADLDFPKTGI